MPQDDSKRYWTEIIRKSNPYIWHIRSAFVWGFAIGVVVGIVVAALNYGAF